MDVYADLIRYRELFSSLVRRDLRAKYKGSVLGLAWTLALPAAALIVVFVAGFSLAVAALNAIFRDVEFVVAAALLPWFFLTPVLYQLDDLPGAESRPWLVDLIHWGNPLTPAIETYRTPLYAGELPPAADAIYLCVAAVVALVVGALVFSSVDDRIASEA